MKYLGIDYGKVRIGLALGENGVSLPIKIVLAKNWRNALNEILREYRNSGADSIVFGMPSGKAQKKENEGFLNYMKSNIGPHIVIHIWNEDLTSKEALGYAIKAGYSKKKRRYTDDLAACCILNSFMQSNYEKAI